MPIAASDMQMPVRLRFVSVPVRVAVDASGPDAPERNGAKPDQQHAAKHFAAAFDDQRKRPAEHDDRAGTKRQEQRVSDGESHRDAERTGAPHRWRFSAGAHRQRRDRHQVIRAESVKKSENESRGEQNQDVTAAVSRRR